MDKARELAEKEARLRYENSRELMYRAQRIHERDSHAYDLLLDANSQADAKGD